MKRISLLLCMALLLDLSGHTQQVIDLSGTWQLAIGNQADYKDSVILPGSLLTNNKGAAPNIDDHHYLRPIPQTYLDIIQKDGHALSAAEKQEQQNPGY